MVTNSNLNQINSFINFINDNDLYYNNLLLSNYNFNKYSKIISIDKNEDYCGLTLFFDENDKVVSYEFNNFGKLQGFINKNNNLLSQSNFHQKVYKNLKLKEKNGYYFFYNNNKIII